MTHGIIPQWNRTEAIIFATVAGIAMLLNAAEIILLIKDHKNLRPIEQLLLSLSISDFLLGLLSAICWTTVLSVGLTNFWEATIFLLAGFSFIMSLTNLTLISVERFIAVRSPFKHMTWMTKNRMKRIIIVTWIKTFVLMSALLIGQLTKNTFSTDLIDIAKLVTSIIIVISGIMFVAIYVYIIRYFKGRRAPEVERQHDQISQGTVKHHNQKREINLIVTSVLIILSYVICLYPFAFEIFINGKDSMNTTILACSNSVFNPLVYFYKGLREKRQSRLLVSQSIKGECSSDTKPTLDLQKQRSPAT